MSDLSGATGSSHLVWVYTDSPATSLDSATWLTTTQELRKLGWHVTLVVVGSAGRQHVRGVEVLGIPMPNVYLVRQCAFHLRLLRLLARERRTVDVILFHQMSAPWLLPLRFVRRLIGQQRPLLVMDTRTMPMTMMTLKDRVRASFYQFTHRLANRWADGQTAITQRMATAVCIPSKQLWGIWPSGVNLDLFIPAQTERRWPQPGEPIHLIYVGVMYPERNLLTLCRAVQQANAEGMTYGLSLVGSGPERLALEQFALQTDRRIQVLPAIPHDQVPKILAQAHIGVLPFPNEEKFRVSSHIKQFEYMAAGLPLLATRTVSHMDVVGSGGYAFWAEDASEASLLAALRRAWQERDALGQMGHEAASAAQSWTWAASAKKLSTALEDRCAAMPVGRRPGCSQIS